jgi:hypothetical protein
MLHETCSGNARFRVGGPPGPLEQPINRVRDVVPDFSCERVAAPGCDFGLLAAVMRRMGPELPN